MLKDLGIISTSVVQIDQHLPRLISISSWPPRRLDFVAQREAKFLPHIDISATQTQLSEQYRAIP